MRSVLFVLPVFFCSAVSEGALFLGPAMFSTTPWSQIGPVTNNLVLTNTPNGFVVSGQVIVATPAAPVQGILVEWIVDRPLDATFGTATMTTTTQLSGFSSPPAGTFQNTLGYVTSEFTNFSGPSLSQINMSLVAGVDSPPWLGITVSGSPFTYTSGGIAYLRQHFWLDGVYLTGSGGNWTVDVPVATLVSASHVPEPQSLGLAIFGGAAVSLYCRRPRAKSRHHSHQVT